MTPVIAEAAGSPASATTSTRSDPPTTGESSAEARPAGGPRRVTLGHLVGAIITLVAINGLLGQIGSFRDVGAALARAEWVWIVAAVVCCILTFPAGALGVRAGLGVDLPLGPVTALQLSSKFANLVTPAGLGSTALNVRFLQRQGVNTASAITADLATSVVSGVAEVALVAICFRAVGRAFDLGELPPGTGRAVLIAVIVVGITVAIVAQVPKVRKAVIPHLRRAATTIVGLVRSPRRTLVIAGSTLAVSTLYAVCLGLSLRAYGHELPLATLIIVNWAATTIGGLSPAPGGLGVAEAGLVAGLTAVGVPADIAVAAALTHRLVTFWLPPIAGWVATRGLRRRQLL